MKPGLLLALRPLMKKRRNKSLFEKRKLIKPYPIMPKESAGILLYTQRNKVWEVLLVHPGGPFWGNKDKGVWSIPKGEIEKGENILEAAIRETSEELGIQVAGNFIQLTPLKQKSGKIVHAWALKRNIDVNIIKSNSFALEWPPKSGDSKSFPEIDKAAWFSFPEAKRKILLGQLPFITELEQLLQINSYPILHPKPHKQ